MITVRGERECDFSKFMEVPNMDEERSCYQSFYDGTSSEALLLETCPICAREKLARDGQQTLILSDNSVLEVLMMLKKDDGEKGIVILRDLLYIDEKGVSCWMCLECMKALE